MTAIGNLEWMNQLLSRGADPLLSILPYDLPPVHYAASTGRISSLKVPIVTCEKPENF